MKNATASCALVLTMLMIAAGCGGSDGDDAAPADAPAAADNATADANADESDEDAASDSAADEAGVNFGDLIEGSFLLSGAVEEQFFSGDEELAFRMSGGCQGDAFGFGVNVTDAAATTTYATFGADGQLDLSGGATGEFDDVDFEVNVFPGGDMSVNERYKGPVTMVISENTASTVGGDKSAERMTVTLLGTVPATNGSGDLDVDITYRWALGCA